MAYKPSLQELQSGLEPSTSSEGYQPSLEELQGGLPPAPSLLQRVGRGAYNVLGGTLEGAIQGAANVGNLPLQALGQKPFFKGVHIPGVQEGATTTQLARGGGKGIPAGIIAALLGPETLLETMGASGIGGAAAGGQTPEQRLKSGILAATLPAAISGAALGAKVIGKSGLKIGKALSPKYWSKNNIANLITKTHGEQKSIAKGLYNQAFEGTKDIKPISGIQSQSAIGRILRSPAGKRDIEKSVERYKNNTTVEGLHDMRADFGSSLSKLKSKELKSGLDAVDGDKKVNLIDARNGIDDDLERSMSQASPEKYNQYQLAQQHWKQNVVPFKAYPSLRKLLGPDHEITKTLYNDVARKAVQADQLKSLLKMDSKTMGIAKYLKASGKKAAIWGIPTAVGLGAAHRFLGE